ncbi:MAG: 4Fe-4S binding protein, partial [Bdellovibrionales bacterium]|nr:4Fe-4S binding protein [Bdellovibrionales bacterium]
MNENFENSFSVIPDRPPSLDEKGFRKFVIPAEVQGFFRRRRDFVYAVLLLIFLVLPWTRFKGEQSVLLDLPHRRFVFFGHSFFAHDGPLLFFFLALFTFGILLVTALFGRLWCGWACPQ